MINLSLKCKCLFYLLGDVINQDHSMAVLVKDPGDRPEVFLACRVPELKLDVFFVVDTHDVVSEFDADGHSVLFLKFFLDEAAEHAGFAYARVADDDYFEESVVLDF